MLLMKAIKRRRKTEIRTEETESKDTLARVPSMHLDHAEEGSAQTDVKERIRQEQCKTPQFRSPFPIHNNNIN